MVVGLVVADERRSSLAIMLERLGYAGYIPGDEWAGHASAVPDASVKAVAQLDALLIDYDLVGPQHRAAYWAARGAGVPCIDATQAEVELIAALGARSDEVDAAKRRHHAREVVFAAGLAPIPASLIIAVLRNDAALIGSLLELDLSPDTVDESMVPAICLAARASSWDALYALIDAGADITVSAPDRGSTILHELAVRQMPERVADIVRRGVDVNALNASGQNALTAATAARDEETAMVLLDSGSDPHVPDALGMTARKYGELYGLSGLVSAIDARKTGDTSLTVS